MVVKGASNAEQTDLMIRIGRVQLLIIGVVYFGIILFGQEFFHLWIGDSLGRRTQDCWFVTVVILIPYGFLLLQALGWQILQARNAMKYRVSVLTVSSFLSLVSGYILSCFWGCKGLAIGTSLSIILGQGLFMNWFYWKKLGLEIPRFFKETLQRAWLWAPPLILSAWGLNSLFAEPAWNTFILKVIIFTLVYAVLLALTYANESEKHLLTNVLKKK